MRDSRNRPCPRRGLLLLLQLAALVTVVTSLPVNHHQHPLERRAPISSNVDSRQQCSSQLGTCQFYSHCIESLFLCESTGFSIAYAEKRCEQIRRLQSLGVTQDQVVRWQLDSERCFQQRLLELVSGEFQNSTADPPSCLRLERKAIEQLNSCYETANPSICSLLDQAQSLDSLEYDLSVVVNAVGIDDSYYRATAEDALLNSIRRCSHTESGALADNLVSRPLPRRLVFCIYGVIFPSTGGEVPPQSADYITRLSAEFNRSREQFVYSSRDTMRVCSVDTPQEASSTLDYHLVTWLANANDPVALDVHSEPVSSYDGTKTFIFFEKHQEKRLTVCGNGRRDAGELCDYSGGDGNCNISTCLPVSDFECHTHRGPASCWRTQCGDGVRTSGEGCDDGNNIAGDGCSSDCTIEAQFQCSSEYNRTSSCLHHPEMALPTEAAPSSWVASTHTDILAPTSNLATSGATNTAVYSSKLLLSVVLCSLLTIQVLLPSIR